MTTQAIRILFLGIAFFAISALADNLPRGDSYFCQTYSSPMLRHDIEYCVDRSRPDLTPAPGEPVAYYMHGLRAGAEAWVNGSFHAALAKLRNKERLPAMTFVSFDTSGLSFFSDDPSASGPTNYSKAYETWLVNEFIPYIEKTYNVCDQRKCRGLLGQSMGGFGALKTGLKHLELFSAIAVNSPALSPFEGFPPYNVWLNYYEHKVFALEAHKLVNTIFHLFPTQAIFEANNPTFLTENFNSTYPYPALYFDMGGRDKYGFYDGYKLFKNALDKKHIPYTTLFDPNAGHYMQRKHAIDSISFVMKHIAP